MSTRADIQRLDSILAAIEQNMIRLYGQTYKNAVQIKQVREAIAAGKTFSWMDSPSALNQFEDMLAKLTRNVALLTTTGIKTSINTGAAAGIMAANKNSGLTEEEEQEEQEEIAQKVIDKHRDTAKGGFTSLTADDNTDRLSDRVWELNQQSKTEMEIIIQNGIKQGKTADEIANSVKSYLLNPDNLFRRVRNAETGKLELSEAAKNYHPGPGVYRSAYANAMRLARTEVNAAYMQAETMSYIENPLVVGVRIEKSKNHTTKMPDGSVKPLYDICDELAGNYPKDFVFTGWHPHCRCFMTPILATPKQAREGTAQKVEQLPQNFKSWISANTDRIMTARTIPYFVRNNKQKIATEMKVDKTILGRLDLQPEDMSIFSTTYSEERKQQAVIFETLEDALKRNTTLARQQYATFTPDEDEAIRMYTGCGSDSMNQYLVGEGDQTSKFVKKISTNLYNGIIKCKSEFDTYLFRASSRSNFKRLFGKEVDSVTEADYNTIATQDGFMSCGTSRKMYYRPGSEVTYVIFAPKGTSMTYFAGMMGLEGENETIVNCGTNLKLIKVDRQQGRFIVYLDIVGQQKPKRLQ